MKELLLLKPDHRPGADPWFPSVTVLELHATLTQSINVVFSFTHRILVQTPKTVIQGNWTTFTQSFSNLAYHLTEGFTQK